MVPSDRSGPEKRGRSPEDGGSSVSDECLQSLDAELCRSRLTFELSTKLRRVCTDAGIADTGIFVGFVFESIAATSVFANQYPSASNDDRRRWVRQFVHPVLDRDTRRRVKWQAAQAPTEPSDGVALSVATSNVETTARRWMQGTLMTVRFLNGNVLGSVAVESSDTSPGGDPVLVDVVLTDLELLEPEPLDLDPLLPCGEIVLPHRSPQSVYMLALSKLCEKDTVKSSTYKAKKRAAWAVADAATALARDARRAMAEYRPCPTPFSISVSYEGPHPQDAVCLALEHTELTAFPFPVAHRIVRWQFDKLSRLYEGSLAGSAEVRGAKEEFPFRLFILLQRYSALTTQLSSREEAGWHAAIPSAVLDFLQERMKVRAECFASPLNAQLSSYCSAFLDTDKWFGSLGPFLEFRPASGCYEVNPPFDHEVCRLAFDHALACIESAAAAEEPLGFIFIVPHSDRDSGLKVRASVDRSPFHVASLVLPREKAKYVDGFQHLPGADHQSLVSISCPTRVVLLMTPKACDVWHPVSCLEELKVLWSSASERT